jgi:hypothetical protein
MVAKYRLPKESKSSKLMMQMPALTSSFAQKHTYNLSANTPSFGNGMWSVISGTGTFADATDPNTLISDLSAGENKLVWTITSYFTCPSSSDTINLTIGHPAPEITSNAPLCEGSTLILEIVDPSPFTNFNWFDPNNNLVGTTSTLTIPNVTPSMQGVYTVYLTDEYGCEISGFERCRNPPN